MHTTNVSLWMINIAKFPYKSNGSFQSTEREIHQSIKQIFLKLIMLVNIWFQHYHMKWYTLNDFSYIKFNCMADGMKQRCYKVMLLNTLCSKSRFYLSLIGNRV